MDATLWFVHAIERHVSHTGDVDLAAEVIDDLHGVITAHVAGTRYGIRVDPADGLLTQGADGVALTWMDARINGRPVTPRVGKPVEVNALWVNALAGVSALAQRVGQEVAGLPAMHRRAAESFAARFPAPAGWLYDVIDGPAGDDGALRPNQLLAYSLPYGPLRGQQPAAEVGQRLLTPVGLRSLARTEPGYVGTHRGDPGERDAAYHQGTVWPWWIGPYADTVAQSPGTAPELLSGIEAHLSEWGLGSVSETADGDAPHHATGCPFQAWSVAESLRARRLLG